MGRKACGLGAVNQNAVGSSDAASEVLFGFFIASKSTCISTKHNDNSKDSGKNHTDNGN